jgi:hypothetical protein
LPFGGSAPLLCFAVPFGPELGHLLGRQAEFGGDLVVGSVAEDGQALADKVGCVPAVAISVTLTRRPCWSMIWQKWAPGPEWEPAGLLARLCSWRLNIWPPN